MLEDLDEVLAEIGSVSDDMDRQHITVHLCPLAEVDYAVAILHLNMAHRMVERVQLIQARYNADKELGK